MGGGVGRVGLGSWGREEVLVQKLHHHRTTRLPLYTYMGSI